MIVKADIWTLEVCFDLPEGTIERIVRLDALAYEEGSDNLHDAVHDVIQVRKVSYGPETGDAVVVEFETFNNYPEALDVLKVSINNVRAAIEAYLAE